MAVHRTLAELEAGIDHIRSSPSTAGTLDLIVRRSTVDEREVVDTADLDRDHGLVGDSWRDRLSPEDAENRLARAWQLTVMNSRAIALIAIEPERWSLAGDQLYVDFDLSEENVPPGTRIAVGEAVIEVSEPPHRGCQKFSSRFGLEALRFVNSEVGRDLHLRGINAKVVTAGRVRRGDPVRKLAKE